MDYSSPGGIRSPFSPRVGSSRRPVGSSQLAGKFGQADELPVGDVIYKTPQMVLQSYGAPLPVTVTEALTFSRNEISARMSSSWCWLIWGRRVLAWPLAGGVARELTLPQTDLAHSADLVMLLDNGQQMPACIGVSPEGLVRFWPTVSQAAVFAETACELAGQECCELQRVAPDAVVLATTSRTLLLLTTDDRPSIHVRVLRGAGSLLGGLSRRVASLLFPTTPPSDAKLVGIVVFPTELSSAAGGPDGGLPWVALLSQRAELQLWCQDNLYQHSLQAALHAPQGEAGSVGVCVEAATAPAPRTLLLLLSAGRGGGARLALATISVEDPTSPRVTSLTGISGGAAGAGGSGGAGGPLKLLPLQNTHVLYTPTAITLLHRGELDLSGEGDSVVCASSAGNVAVLLSHKHGVLRLTPGKNVPVESGAESPRAARLYDGNLAILEIDPDQLEATDAIGKLKLALLHHVRGSPTSCRALLAELAGSSTEAGSSPELTRCVLSVASELLDDMPCGDPRWPREECSAVGAAGVALGASSALQLQQQLRDKRRVLRMLCDMLHTHLPSNPAAPGGTSAHAHAHALWSGLCALDELCALGLALRRAQTYTHAASVERALHDEACSGSSTTPAERAALAAGRLSPSDVCYRRLTTLWRVLPRLQDPAALEAALVAARAGRGAWGAEPPPRAALLTALADSLQRYITGRNGAGDAGATEAGATAEAGAARAEQALAAAELVLSDAARLPPPQWQRLRRGLIDAFMEVGARELAALLAEKFGDLELLVNLCVETEDLPRLYKYMDMYSAEGIEPLAAKGVLDGSGKLRAQYIRSAPAGGAARVLGGRPALLALWLLRRAAPAPPAPRPAEAAVPALLAAGAHPAAGRVTAHVTASLAKLCLLATEDPLDDVDDTRARVEARLQLCEQQADRPGGELLPAEDLVQTYLDTDPDQLTEYDYKKALDVTELIEDEQMQQHYRLKVFAAAILQNSWTDGVEALDDYMFCKLLQLLQLTGGDLGELVPRRATLLTQTALASLSEDPHFRFLLRHAYDNIHPEDQYVH